VNLIGLDSHPYPRSESPYETSLVAGPSNKRLESLEAKISREVGQGRKGTMDRALSGRMVSIWPSESSDLVVYPEVSDVDRARFTRGQSSSLAS